MNEQLWGLQQRFMFMHEQEMVKQDRNEPIPDQPSRSLNRIRRVPLSWRPRTQTNLSPSPEVQFAENMTAD
jgi:hypothetical protein